MSRSSGISKSKLCLGLITVAAFALVVTRYWDADGERVMLKEEAHQRDLLVSSLKEKVAKMSDEVDIAKAERNDVRHSFESCKARSEKAKAGAEEQINSMHAEVESLRRLLKSTEQLVSEKNASLVQERNKTAGLQVTVANLEQAVANSTKKETAARKEANEKSSQIRNLAEQVEELKASVAGLTRKEAALKKRRIEEEDNAQPSPRPKVAAKLERAVKSEVHRLSGDDAVLSPISRTLEKEKPPAKVKAEKEKEREKEESYDKLLREQIENLGANKTAKPTLPVNGTATSAPVMNTTQSSTSNSTVAATKQIGTTAKADKVLEGFLKRGTAAKKKESAVLKEEDVDAELASHGESEEGGNEEKQTQPARKPRRGDEARNEVHEL